MLLLIDDLGSLPRTLHWSLMEPLSLQTPPLKTSTREGLAIWSTWLSRRDFSLEI